LNGVVGNLVAIINPTTVQWFDGSIPAGEGHPSTSNASNLNPSTTRTFGCIPLRSACSLGFLDVDLGYLTGEAFYQWALAPSVARALIVALRSAGRVGGGAIPKPPCRSQHRRT
jgi:hypothetical protein